MKRIQRVIEIGRNINVDLFLHVGYSMSGNDVYASLVRADGLNVLKTGPSAATAEAAIQNLNSACCAALNERSISEWAKNSNPATNTILYIK